MGLIAIAFQNNVLLWCTEIKLQVVDQKKQAPRKMHIEKGKKPPLRLAQVSVDFNSNSYLQISYPMHQSNL